MNGHGGSRKRDNTEAGQVKRERRSDYWARLEAKLEKFKRIWKAKRDMATTQPPQCKRAPASAASKARRAGSLSLRTPG